MLAKPAHWLMALDALPDEDFPSYKIGSACATAAQAFPIRSADTHCTDLKEEPSSLCGEQSLPLLQTPQRRAHYTCAISSSAWQALPLTSKSQPQGSFPYQAPSPLSPDRPAEGNGIQHRPRLSKLSPKGRLSKLSPNGENSLTLSDDRATEVNQKRKSLFKSLSLPARQNVLISGCFSQHYC